MARNKSEGLLRGSQLPLEQAHTPLPEGALGASPEQTVPALQSDIYKELINKLAWALGSVYREQYGSVHNPVRKYAMRMARQVLKDNGYPHHITWMRLNGAGSKLDQAEAQQ